MEESFLPNQFVTAKYQFLFSNHKDLGGRMVHLRNEKEQITHVGMAVEAHEDRLCVVGYDPVNNKAKMLTFFPQDFVATTSKRPKWVMNILRI